MRRGDVSATPTHVVTGAFGYSGKHIARRLLAKGYIVKTLTNSTGRRHPFEDQVVAEPFHFEEPEKLAAFLSGAAVLYNTYWIRFNHRDFGFPEAIRNSRALFNAAREAGVKRIVHVSITNPSTDSPFEYYRGKALVEKALQESGISYAILRPAVLFGAEDILVNNIAWTLRQFPVFGMFGDGNYRLQPIHVEDFAQLAIEAGERRTDDIIEAIGPETFTYRGLVEALGAAIGKPRPIVSVPRAIGYAAAAIVGKIVGDVVVTRDEVDALMADLLYVEAPPAGATSLRTWAIENAETLGKYYASELRRRQDRLSDYKDM